MFGGTGSRELRAIHPRQNFLDCSNFGLCRADVRLPRTRPGSILGSNQVSSVPLAQWIARWTSNPKVLGSTPRWDGTYWSVSVVVITSALHAEGRQFEPGTDQIFAPCDSFECAAVFVKLLSFRSRHLKNGAINIDCVLGYIYISYQHGKLLHEIKRFRFHM